MEKLNNKPVPIPLSRKFKIWRLRILPFLVWLTAILISLTLINRNTQQIDARGVMEIKEAVVSPIYDGVINELSVDLFDPVEKGQLVAIMDDTIIKAQLSSAAAEISQIKSELEAGKETYKLQKQELKFDELNDLRRLAVNDEESRLDYLDRMVVQEIDKIELQRLEILYKRYEKLVEEKIIADITYRDTKLQYEHLKKKIQENEPILKEAKKRMEDSQKRLQERNTEKYDTQYDTILQPIKERIRTQEARLKELNEQRKFLVLKSPLAGKVTSIFHRIGETVLSGTPILTVSSPDSSRVIAYVNEKSAAKITAGLNANIFSKREKKQVLNAKVIKVSSKIEEMPTRLRRNPMIPEWGYSVLIGETPPHTFLPGEILDVKFSSR